MANEVHRHSDGVYDEIELREILLFLWDGRWWGLGGLLLALVVGLLFFAVRPPEYVATAWVRLQMSPLQEGSSPALAKDLEFILTSPSWLQKYLEERPSHVGLEATVFVSTSLIRLEATAPSPEEAYRWAQSWAEGVVAWALERQESRLRSLEEAIQLVRKEFEKARDEYRAFLAQNPSSALEIQVAQLEYTLTCLRTQQQHDTIALADLERFMDALSRKEASSQDVLILMMLQERVFGKIPCSEGGVVLFGAGGMALPEERPAKLDLETQAKMLHEMVSGRLQATSGQIVEVQKELERLRGRLEEIQEEEGRLRARQEQLWAYWQDLEEQYRELRMDFQQNPAAVLESPPVFPQAPRPRNVMLPVLSLAIVGAILGWMAYGMKRALASSNELEHPTP